MSGESWFQKVREDESPGTIRLAESLATATLIETELIRHIRLKLHPDLDTGAESDLWFSGFVGSRAHDGIIFDSRAAHFLRRQLQTRSPDLYQVAWNEVAGFHKELPPAVRIEEEMAYLSALPREIGLGKIRGYLQSALAALVAGERSGIATWTIRALPQMPAEVRGLEEARMLEAAARLRLTGDAALLESNPDWQWLIPSVPAETTSLGVRLFPGIIEIGPEGPERATRMEVSNLEPVSLRVTWAGGETSLSVGKGDTRRLRVGAGPIRIAASTGETFEIVSDDRSEVIDFSDLLQRYDTFYGASNIERAVGPDLEHGGALRVVVGPPGYGKTAVLNYFARLRRRGPDQPTREGEAVIYHFFSRTSGRYRDPNRAIRSLWAQLERLVPDVRFPEHLTDFDRLEYVLRNGEFRSTVVMILDALDEADGGTTSRVFRLLEQPLAGQVCVLASCTRDGPVHKWFQDRPRVAWYQVEDWPEVLAEAVRAVVSRDAEPRLRERFIRLAGNNPLWAALLSRYKFWAEEIEETEPLMMVWQAIWRWTATDQPDYMRALAVIAAMQEPVPEDWVAQVIGRGSGKLWPEFFERTAAFLDRHRRDDGTITYCPCHEEVRRFILDRFARETPNPDLRIAQTIARWPLSDNADPEMRAYAVEYALHHAAVSDDPYLLFRRSTDLGYLQERLKAMGAARIASEIRSLPLSGDVEAFMKATSAVADAMEWNAHLLDRDPSLLPSIVHTHVRQVADKDWVYGAIRFPAGIPELRLRQPLREGPPITTPSSSRSAERLTLNHVRTGHRGPVLGGVITNAPAPEVISWSADQTICIWDLASLELRAVARHHGAEVTACALLREPDLFVSTGRDGCVAVFTPGKPAIFDFHGSAVLGVLALPVPQDAPPRFITWSADRTLRVWTLDDGRLRLLGVLRGHTDEVLCCDVGRFVVSGSADGTVRLWDLNSYKELARLEGQGAVTVVKISPVALEGSIAVVFGSQDCSVGFWQIVWKEIKDGGMDLNPGRAEKMTGHTLGILDCQVLFERDVVLSASLDQTVRLWDLLDGTVLQTLTGHEAAVLRAGFLTDNIGISASADRTVRTWDLEDGRLVDTFSEHSAPVRGLVRMPDHQIISCSDDRSMMLWEVIQRVSRESAQKRPRPMPRPPTRIDGNLGAARVCFVNAARTSFYTVSRRRGFEIADVGSDNQHQFRQVEGAVRGSVASVRLGMSLVWTDQEAFLWRFIADAELGGHITAFPAEIGQGIRAAAFIAGRRLAVAYSRTNQIAIMDAFGPVLTRLSGHQDAVAGLASDSEGRLLVSASNDRTLRVWNGDSLQALAVLSGHTDRVAGCALTPNTGRVVSYSADRTLRVWEPSGSSFVPAAILRGHRDDITCVVIEPLTERTISGSRDGTIRIWDTSTGRELHVLEGHGDWVTALSISEDGRWIVSASEDETVKLWDSDAGACHGTVVGVCPFVSVMVADGVVCAGDQAGNIWRLEYGKLTTAPFASASKIVILTTSADRPLAEQLRSMVQEVLKPVEIITILDLDKTSEAWQQGSRVGEADVTLVLATERMLAVEDAHPLDQAMRRAAAGRLLIPIWENLDAWRHSELMNYQGIVLKAEGTTRFLEVAHQLRTILIRPDAPP